MNYTRRRVLRDAATVSLGLAASSSLPFLTTSRAWGSSPPASFNSGIRIFFIGAWIFCKDPVSDGRDPASNGLLAVTADLPTPIHKFPYGVWPGPSGIDSNPTTLSANPTCDMCGQRNSYCVTLPGFTSPHSTTADFFANGCSDNFNYFDNGKSDLSIDFTNPQIRVISLPIPTAMITADTITSSYVGNADGRHQFHGHSSGANAGKSNEVSAAHILEYDGANALCLDKRQMISQASSSFSANFHFHTVPTQPVSQNHGEEMFGNLISLVPSLSASDFTPTGFKAIQMRGSNVPTSVDSIELQLPPRVTAVTPADGATGVAIGSPLTATFSRTMNSTTIDAANFTLNVSCSAPVTGVVTYTDPVATFTPSAPLAYDTKYTATITIEAQDSAGISLAANYSWSFTTEADSGSRSSAKKKHGMPTSPKGARHSNGCETLLHGNLASCATASFGIGGS